MVVSHLYTDKAYFNLIHSNVAYTVSSQTKRRCFQHNLCGLLFLYLGRFVRVWVCLLLISLLGMVSQHESLIKALTKMSETM